MSLGTDIDLSQGHIVLHGIYEHIVESDRLNISRTLGCCHYHLTHPDHLCPNRVRSTSYPRPFTQWFTFSYLMVCNGVIAHDIRTTLL